MSKNKSPATRHNIQEPQSERRQQIVSAQWSGPLPPPDALERFNEIITNGAERIIVMVEKEQAHRITQEQSVLKARVKDTARGQWLGGLIAILATIGCIYSVRIGAHPTVSIALIGVPLMSLGVAIIRSRSNSGAKSPTSPNPD